MIISLLQAEILITPGNEGVVHHAVLYSCWGKDMEHLRGSDKQNGVCYSAEMPEYAESCKTVTFAWAVGGSVSSIMSDTLSGIILTDLLHS